MHPLEFVLVGEVVIIDGTPKLTCTWDDGELSIGDLEVVDVLLHVLFDVGELAEFDGEDVIAPVGDIVFRNHIVGVLLFHVVG